MCGTCGTDLKDISIHTSRGEGGNNVKRAVALAAQGKLRCAELVTHHFALDDIATAFRCCETVTATRSR